MSDEDIMQVRDFIEFHAYWECRRIRNGMQHYEDIQQSVWIEIMKAMGKYNPDRCKVISFVKNLVKWEIKRYWKRVGVLPWEKETPIRLMVQLDAATVKVAGLRGRNERCQMLSRVLV